MKTEQSIRYLKEEDRYYKRGTEDGRSDPPASEARLHVARWEFPPTHPRLSFRCVLDTCSPLSLHSTLCEKVGPSVEWSLPLCGQSGVRRKEGVQAEGEGGLCRLAGVPQINRLLQIN